MALPMLYSELFLPVSPPIRRADGVLSNPDGSPRFTPPTGFFVRPQTYTAPPPDNEQLPAYEPPKKNAQGQDPGQVV